MLFLYILRIRRLYCVELLRYYVLIFFVALQLQRSPPPPPPGEIISKTGTIYFSVYLLPASIYVYILYDVYSLRT